MAKLIKQLFPDENNVELKTLYLTDDLKEIARKLQRPVVTSNYITDINDVIAVKGQGGPPPQIKNEDDWRAFQNLLAQTDVLITAKDYLQRVQEKGLEEAQNILTQFEEGGEYQELGEWRLKNGYEKRSPDIALVSRSLDFDIPQILIDLNKKITVFTTHEMYMSDNAERLRNQKVDVVASGTDGVDGQTMINHLGYELGYEVIKMTTGPSILSMLLESNMLDRLYITQVQTKIEVDTDKAIRVFKNKKIEEMKDFKLVEKYIQKDIITKDGSIKQQYFLVYDHQRFIMQRSAIT